MFCKINSKWTLQQMLTKIEHIKHIAFCLVSNRNTQCTFNPNKTIDHMILTFQPKFCQKIFQFTKIQKLTFLTDVCISFSNVECFELRSSAFVTVEKYLLLLLLCLLLFSAHANRYYRAGQPATLQLTSKEFSEKSESSAQRALLLTASSL